MSQPFGSELYFDPPELFKEDPCEAFTFDEIEAPAVGGSARQDTAPIRGVKKPCGYELASEGEIDEMRKERQ